MSFRTLRTSRTALMALTLAAAAQAQSVSTAVIKETIGDTVTYAVTLEGPAAGGALLFVAPRLAATPVTVAPFGTWSLDMAVQSMLGYVPLDAAGRARLEIKVPALKTIDLNICFQAVSIDFTSRELRFSTWASAWQSESMLLAGGWGLAASYSKKTGRYDFAGVGLPRGSKLVVKVNGKPVCVNYAMADGRVRGFMQMPALGPGDTMEFEIDGKPVTKFEY